MEAQNTVSFGFSGRSLNTTEIPHILSIHLYWEQHSTPASSRNDIRTHNAATAPNAYLYAAPHPRVMLPGANIALGVTGSIAWKKPSNARYGAIV